MSHHSSFASNVPSLLRTFTATGEDAPPIEDKIKLARLMRARAEDAGLDLDEVLVREIHQLASGLNEASDKLASVQALVESMCEPPLHLATLLEVDGLGFDSARAVVCQGGSRQLVTISNDVDPSTLRVGDEVLLSAERNAILGSTALQTARGGETAVFERLTGDGRLVVRSRDEEIVVLAGHGLPTDELRSGDLVRWDRQVPMAYEKLERSQGAQLMLESTPEQTFDEIGGCDGQILALKRFIEIHLHHREVARRYGLRRKGGVLLVGPPGTGKTMIVRALANWLAQVSPSGRSRFMNIKPSGLLSMWFGQTEANYREAFRVARLAGEEEPDVPVVMFFDEVDSVGSARSDSLARAHDRVLPSLMAELDGLESRGNVLVVAATNRIDALDPALLRPGRLGDQILEIPRPDRRAAGEILGKYLHAGLPYAADRGAEGEPQRETLIAAVLARVYSPNGSSDLAKLTLRDGRCQVVRARDLMSGASIAKIVASATERACIREIETGEVGVRLDDLAAAIDEELEQAASVLTPMNCRRHLSGLPQDVDVVAVEPAHTRTSGRNRYLQRTA